MITEEERVESGVLTVTEAASEFARQWQATHPRASQVVTQDQFLAYYRDVAAAFQTGDRTGTVTFEHPPVDPFVMVVANVWHLPGRGSWQGRRGKRVLVTFHKGTSTETVS
jgi:hypothetical protein